MNINSFLNAVCNEIKYKPIRKEVSEELQLHIEEVRNDYINNGVDEKEAEEKAVLQMGVPEEIGKKLNKVHRPKLDWKLLILILTLIGFSIMASILKEPYSGQEHMISYIVIGIVLGVSIYFFDYKKLNDYSNLIYILASVIMILPMIGMVKTVGGVLWVNIFGITFMPCTITVPLYTIAFIGFIANYEKSKDIKLSILDKEILIKVDLIKIIMLSIFSLILMMYIPSISNAMILGFTYLVIGSVKIAQNKKHIRKLIITYASILIIIVCGLAIMMKSPAFRTDRIIASFKPEIDPNGSGYVGMLQKEILDNAKIVGEAEIEPIQNDENIINNNTNYTFIYIVGKAGILVSSILVLTILLTSIRLILNAKNIKEQYGKLLTIGLGTLYIFQSIANVLMNINMGIQTDVGLPFVTYGGTYFIANILGIAIIFSIYRRKDINLCEKNNDDGIIRNRTV